MFEPKALVFVEVHHRWRWIRFTLAGDCVYHDIFCTFTIAEVLHRDVSS